MTNKKLMCLIAIIVGLGSQVNLHYDIPGFIITLAVILLAILIHIFDVSYYKTIFLTAFISPLIRGLILFVGNQNFQETIYLVSPDIIFYIVYGFIFWLFKDFSKKGISQYVLIVFIADIISNIIEINFRLNSMHIIESRMINYLFLVAVIRTMIVLTSLILHRYYQFFLKKEEHEKRYQRLLLMQSFFKSEIYFMEKNISAIENIMKDAYRLHKISKDTNVQSLSLDISRNIHEVKKDYIRVIDGLHELSSSSNEETVDSLLLSDLINIILTNTREYLDKHQLNILISCDMLHDDLRVQKHYELVSILRNIINNAIEAIEDKGTIEMMILKVESNLVIRVSDNGRGVKAKNIDYIFNLGYSTKFIEGDGKARRGMGLAIVKKLVEKQFNGTIDVVSKLHKGTTFELILPIKDLS